MSDIPSIETDAAVQRVLRLLEIPGISGQEQKVSEAIVQELLAGGADRSQIRYDRANETTRLAGQTGNLLFHLPGDPAMATRMLSAHMDTVPVCEGCSPSLEGEVIRSSSGTGLGADDRSGCAAILTAALEALKRKGEHPPLVFAWFVQEEVGLEGARHLDSDAVGDIGLAFNFDGGTVEKLTVGATGGERIEIKVSGRAAHAGIAPEAGVNAITIASLAIHRLHDQGWLGRVEKPEGQGTSNIGVISGGQATNVVTEEVLLRAEARSHDASMRTLIVAEMEGAFRWAVEQVVASDGSIGQVTWQSHVDYESFQISDDADVVQVAAAAVSDVGREPFCEIAGGGLDANWLFQHGIPAVTLGCGQRNIHTVDEFLVVADYLDACQIATKLALGT